MVTIQAGTRFPVVAVMAGAQRPVISANGRAGGFRRTGGRTAIMVDGVPMEGRRSPLIGSGVPAVAPLIILSQIGEARPAGGVIRSHSGVTGLRNAISLPQPDLPNSLGSPKPVGCALASSGHHFVS